MVEEPAGVVVEWIPLYRLREGFEQGTLRRARDGWVEVRSEDILLMGRLRLVGDRGVYVRCWLSKCEGLIDEIVDSLSQPLESVDEFEDAWSEACGTSWYSPELIFFGDGRVSTPYLSLTWFHGQATVNRLLKRRGVQLVRDYDGITRVETKVSRPFRRDRVDGAIEAIAKGLRVYAAVRRVQEAEALKITLALSQVLWR